MLLTSASRSCIRIRELTSTSLTARGKISPAQLDMRQLILIWESVGSNYVHCNWVALILLPLEQSRRDDLESLGYMLIYFLKGSLPWQGLKAATKNQKYEKILECKINTSLESLCKGVPGNYWFQCWALLPHRLFCFAVEFKNYFEGVRALRFDDKPDYDFLKAQFRELFFRKGYSYDNEFDWVVATAIQEPAPDPPVAERFEQT